MLRILDIGGIYYLVALFLACVLWIVLHRMQITKRVALTVLIPYLFLVVAATLITRKVRDNSHVILSPFWTIQTILTGGRYKAWLVKEVFLNTIMLMPVGVLTPVIFDINKAIRTLALGMGISITIELFQWFTCRGYAEIDDVIFNMLGVLVGLGIYSVVKKIIIVVNRRRNSARQ